MIIRPNGNTGRLPSARLPAEYQEVEYIESSGAQYINTGLSPTINTGVILDIQYTIPSSTTATFIAAQENYSKKFGFGVRTSGGYYAYQVTSIGGSDNHVGTIDENRHTLSYNYNSDYSFKVDDVTLIDNLYSSSSLTTQPLYMFCYNSGGNPVQYASAKLFSLKIYNSTNLVRDFIPCYRISNNEIGLYDLVNGLFYTNAGTGTFTKGNDVSLTDLFTEVEYIESSGTQYIDTGYTINSNSKINITYQYVQTAPVSGYWASILMNDWTTGITSSTSNGIRVKFNTNYVDIPNKLDTSKHTVSIDTNGVTFDDISYSYTGTEGSNNNDLWLFKQNGSSNSNTSSAKLYSLSFLEDNVLVHNFVPCYRNSDNEVGLYDIVNNVFYTNAGTGVFTTGEIIKDYDILVPKLGDINISKVYLGSTLVYQKVN